MQARFKCADHIIIKADKNDGSILKMNGSWMKHYDTNLPISRSIKSLSVRLRGWGKYSGRKSYDKKKDNAI